MGRNFRTIRAWELADDLAVAVYHATQGFPREEIYGLVSQIRRATVSVAANIAEGSARKTRKDFMHFLNIAQASLVEVEYHIHLSERLGYLSAEATRDLSLAHRETAVTLNGFINMLERNQSNG